MNVQELMTRSVITVQDEDDLDFAAQLMLWNNVRHVPVLRDGEVVGMLSDHDVALRTTLARGSHSERRLSCREVMHVPAETISAADPIARAAWWMATCKIGCLPVVEEGRLVGILTSTDLLRHYAEEGERPREP